MNRFRLLRNLVLQITCAAACSLGVADDTTVPVEVQKLIQDTCSTCHNSETAEGGLDLTRLPFALRDRTVRRRWVLMHPWRGHDQARAATGLLVASRLRARGLITYGED